MKTYYLLLIVSPFIILTIGLIDYLAFAVILPKIFKLKNDMKWYAYIPATLLEWGCFLMGLGIGIKYW